MWEWFLRRPKWLNAVVTVLTGCWLVGPVWAEVGVLPQPSVAKTSRPCRYFTDDAKYVDFTLVMQLENRDVAMRVPLVFLEDAWKQQNGVRHTAILFRTMIDSFEPVTRAQTPHLDFEYTSFLINDYIDLPKIAEHGLDMASPGPASPRQPLSDYTMRPHKYGLEEVIPNYPEELQEDVYLHTGVNGEIDIVVSCNVTGTMQYPECNQFFRTSAGADIPRYRWPYQFGFGQ